MQSHDTSDLGVAGGGPSESWVFLRIAAALDHQHYQRQQQQQTEEEEGASPAASPALAAGASFPAAAGRLARPVGVRLASAAPGLAAARLVAFGLRVAEPLERTVPAAASESYWAVNQMMYAVSGEFERCLACI